MGFSAAVAALGRVREIKIIVTILILIAGAGPLTYAQGVSGGLKAGLNISNAKAKVTGASISTDARTGLNAGVYVKAMLTDKLGIQPELLYSQQGDGKDDESERINYLTLPVLFRYQVNEMFNLHAGPQLGFLLSAEDNDGVSFKDDLKPVNFSLAMGLGVDLPAGFNLSGRYLLGLSNDIVLEGTGLTSDDLKVTQWVLQFSLGYKLFGN